MKNTKKALSVLLFSSALSLTGLAMAGSALADPGELPQVQAVQLTQVSAEPGELPVFVPSIDQPPGQTVNINLASYEQLIALPGIGRVKAAAIIDYRNEVGMFKTLEDIQNIKGIGQKLFERLASKINI